MAAAVTYRNVNEEVGMARDIGGLWRIIQTNGNSVINVTHVTQPQGTFTVDAIQDGSNVQGMGGGNVNGDFVGFVINWNNGTSGGYNGAFDEHGQINGSTFDLKHPGAFAGWHSDRTF